MKFDLKAARARIEGKSGSEGPGGAIHAICAIPAPPNSTNSTNSTAGAACVEIERPQGAADVPSPGNLTKPDIATAKQRARQPSAEATPRLPRDTPSKLENAATRPQPLEPSRQDAETFPHGLSVGGSPLTWTGRVVSLDTWRRLSEWERHGPNGRLWNGITGQWEDGGGA